MNQQSFEAGKAAYGRGDILRAVRQLSAAKEPGEVSGSVDHLLGNCYMRLSRFSDAARCYADALHDASYGHFGALACNRGRALLAAGRPKEAVAALSMAVSDHEYPTPYKAYTALGNAYKRMGNIREAGVAFRNAAIDEGNPDPSNSLCELGHCFMQMGRAVDAVEAYRTALDFATPRESQGAIYGDLGLAYVAANKMSEAVDAFDHATESGHLLRPEVQVAYDAAKKAVAALQGGGPSETDAFLAAAGYGGGIDPLDPTGATGEVIPSPEDTGFFSVTEEEIVANAKKNRKIRRKHRHRGLRVLLILVLLLVLAAGAAGFLYYKGYGWPTQASVVEKLFKDNAAGEDVAPLFASSVSSAERAQMKSTLPVSLNNVTIDNVERSMSSTTVIATVKLSSGGEQRYQLTLTRDGIGWQVSSVDYVFDSQEEGSTTIDTNASPEPAGSSGSSSSTESGATTGTISTTNNETSGE